ncbi:MAG: EAL domain-containing protein [Coxiellaceae bacterium]|nr:EAL domain-containing protein [Coxiellaceae bacterium]
MASIRGLRTLLWRIPLLYSSVIAGFLLVFVLIGFFNVKYQNEIQKELIPMYAHLSQLRYLVNNNSSEMKIWMDQGVKQRSTKLVTVLEVDIPRALEGLSAFQYSDYFSKKVGVLMDDVSHLRWKQWLIIDAFSFRVEAQSDDILFVLQKSIYYLKNNIFLNIVNSEGDLNEKKLFYLYRYLSDMQVNIVRYHSTNSLLYYKAARLSLDRLSGMYHAMEKQGYKFQGVQALFLKCLTLSQLLLDGGVDNSSMSIKYKNVNEYSHMNKQLISDLDQLLVYTQDQTDMLTKRVIILNYSLVVMTLILLLIVLIYSVVRARYLDKQIVQTFTSVNAALNKALAGDKVKLESKSEVNEVDVMIVQLNAMIKGGYVTSRKLKNKTQEMERLAYFDQLTELHTYEYFQECFYKLLRSAVVLRNDIILVYINLKQFHLFATLYDQAKLADSMLEFSHELVSFNSSAIYSKISPSEFFCAIPVEAREHMRSMLSRFNTHVGQAFKQSGFDQFSDFGISAVLYADFPVKIYEIIQYCRYAVAEPADTSKNEFVFTDQQLARYEQYVDIRKGISTAVLNHQIHAVYQPQYAIKDHSVMGFEVLARWQHPKYGMISPTTFIPIAENTGDIHQIAAFVRNKAFADFQRLREQIGDNKIQLSLNASIVELINESYCSELLCDMKKYNIPSDQIEVEITESIITLHSTAFTRTIDELKKQKIGLAIDDFGKEYSSLDRLLEFDFDLFKIDKCFIDHIAHHSKSRDLLISIIKLAEHMGIKTLAEGVETKEQLDILKEYQCDYVQGYYYSKPISADEMLKLLKRDSSQ